MQPPTLPQPPRPQQPPPPLPDRADPLPPDGTPPPQKLPELPPGTDPDAHITPEGPVGGGGQPPRPDLPSIAQELGRLEGKLNRMLSRPPGEGGDNTDVLQLLGQLLELLQSQDPEGSYSLSGPCEDVAEGEPAVVRLAAWAQSAGLQAAIVKRLDALAELLQHHKDLRQPTCKQIPVFRDGTPVTVTFEEVE